jgi:hypothetical protein
VHTGLLVVPMAYFMGNLVLYQCDLESDYYAFLFLITPDWIPEIALFYTYFVSL